MLDGPDRDKPSSPLPLWLSPWVRPRKSGECGFAAKAATASRTNSTAGPRALRTPPCRVMHLRSSRAAAHRLKATVSWAITWEGSLGGGGTPPDGAFGTEQAVVGQGGQAVNR